MDFEESLNSNIMLSCLINLGKVSSQDDINMDEIFKKYLDIYHCVMIYK